MRQPTGQRLSNVRTQQKKSIGPILFLYYEKCLVSSNLNSKQLRFYGVRPNQEVFPDTKGSFLLAIRCTKAIGGTENTAILGNFHLERPLRRCETPHPPGSFQGVFPNILCYVFFQNLRVLIFSIKGNLFGIPHKIMQKYIPGC